MAYATIPSQAVSNEILEISLTINCKYIYFNIKVLYNQKKIAESKL